MKPELVAPAGEFDALKAAIHNGADAVYLGGKKFNARLYAKNFQLRELGYAITYAHQRGVKVYVTVNTLVADRELRELAEYLLNLYALEADAVIIQDLGALRLCRELLPNLKVHASTQMTVHNSDGVRFLSELGIRRVILARELSLKEIRQIKRECNSEIEVFIHGALCFSLSGQCLMSSFLGGRSANRGMCASPCRLPYTIVDSRGEPTHTKGPHVLSMKDLNLSEDIGSLVSAQVDALKIEGRIKSPEYVAVVTGIYRELIDHEPRKPTPQQKRDLEAIFNRGFTKGYLYGNLGGEAISYERPDNQGIQVGVVTEYNNASNVVSILLSEDVCVGDGLEFETPSGKTGLCVTELFMKGKPTSEAFAGCTANMLLPFHPLANSRVGRTRDSVLHARTRVTYSVADQDEIVPIVNSAKISIDRQLLNKKLSSISSSLKSKQTHRSPRICAEVATLPALKEAVRANVSEVYFGGYPSQDLDDYKQALTITKENHIPIAIALPRITLDKGNLKGKILELKGAGADTFLVGDVGTLALLRRMGLRAYLDSSFNIFNSLASRLLFNYAPRLTLSHELHISQIRHIAERAEGELEYIVHGPITLMLSEHCPASDSLSTGNKITCRKLCSNNDFSLKDRKGFLFPIKCDESLNIHILNSVDLCLIDYIPELKASGVDVFRIQGRYYSPNIVGELVRCYRTALSVARGDSRERRVLSSLKKKIRGLSARGISKGKLFSGV